MLRSLLLLVLALLCAALPLGVRSQTANTTWYLCAVLQGSSYQSIDTATLVVNASTSQQKDYNGNTGTAYQALAITSGQRSYTDLTVASPSAVVTAMASLAPPGSTGGNDNLFWPGTYPQMLDGNGLTFNFASNVSVTGQSKSGPQMNLWWASGSNSLDEEVAGGTHETSPMQSTLIISQTQPACTVPASAQFTMCLLINGNGYSSALSGFVNTTGTPRPVASSAANGLSATQQGWTVTSITGGQRIYTPTSGSATTTSISTIAAANSVASNDNLVFPDYPTTGVFDLAGLGFTLSSAAPLSDGSTSSAVTVKYANGQYYEQSAATTEATTSSYIALTPFISGTSVPPCQAVATTYQYCWSVQGSGLFSSVISGVLTINALPAGTASSPYWTVLSISGTRTYTDYTTGATTVSTIVALLSTGSIGGNDNRLYLKGVSSSAPTQYLDGDGISVRWNNIPPIFGQNGAGQTNTTNLWFDGPTYDEENLGGTHEKNTTSSSFTLTAVSTGTTTAPTCSSNNNNNNGAAGSSTALPLLVLALLAAVTSLAL